MKTGIVIQARIGSSRLPGKVLLPLPTRRNVLQEVVRRCKLSAGWDQIVVATPLQDYAMIVQAVPTVYVAAPDIEEDNLVARYATVATALKFDTIIRITADCPLMNPNCISRTLSLFKREKVEYASNCWPKRTFPKGHDVEVFTYGILMEAASASDLTAYDAEHCTPWIQRHAMRTALLEAYEDTSDDRQTLDTVDDYRAIWGRLNEIH